MKFNHQHHSSAYLRKGMSLLEIVIVLGIIGLIMGAGIAAFGGVREGANIRAAAIKMQGFETLLESYKLIGGTYPSEGQGLNALVNEPTTSPKPRKWKQQAPEIPFDPWGYEYVYKFPGTIDRTAPEVISIGSDGQLGTEDDISSQE